MKKTIKKMLSVLLGIALLISLFSVAFAGSDIVPYASKVIHETTAAIRFEAGKVYGAGRIKTVNTADKLGITSISLYEKNGSKWTKLTSAYNKFGYNASNYSYTISAPAVEGKVYKVTVSFYGKIGDLTDTHTQSQTSTY